MKSKRKKNYMDGLSIYHLTAVIDFLMDTLSSEITKYIVDTVCMHIHSKILSFTLLFTL